MLRTTVDEQFALTGPSEVCLLKKSYLPADGVAEAQVNPF